MGIKLNDDRLDTEELSTELHVPAAATAAPAAAEKRARRCWRGCLSKNMLVCVSLWILFALLTMAYSLISPFFPQVVSIELIQLSMHASQCH